MLPILCIFSLFMLYCVRFTCSIKVFAMEASSFYSHSKLWGKAKNEDEECCFFARIDEFTCSKEIRRWSRSKQVRGNWEYSVQFGVNRSHSISILIPPDPIKAKPIEINLRRWKGVEYGQGKFNREHTKSIEANRKKNPNFWGLIWADGSGSNLDSKAVNVIWSQWKLVEINRIKADWIVWPYAVHFSNCHPECRLVRIPLSPTVLCLNWSLQSDFRQQQTIPSHKYKHIMHTSLNA